MVTGSFSSVLLAAVMAAALAATASGCSSDDYYCDNSGCYYCDGVGCRAVAAPTRVPCQGDYMCPASQVCTDLGCTSSCAADTDCARGWVCRGASGSTRGSCVAPTEHTPVPHPGSCTSNADCSGGTVCDASGRCSPPSDVCQFNSQCGAGRVCINQSCAAACSATAPCPTGQACNNGVCVNHPAGQCTADAQCAAGQRCLNSTCFNVCTTSAQCGTGLYCGDQGLCVPDTRRQPFCTSDAQCTAPSQCLDGVCRRPCSTSDECLRTDVSYHNCVPIAYLHTTQRYCLTDHEYRPTCARAADCTAGQSCVDGVCRSN